MNQPIGSYSMYRIQITRNTKYIFPLLFCQGDEILKDNYKKKQDELLRKFNNKKRNATTPEEKRLWSIFFNILREEYASVNDFKR